MNTGTYLQQKSVSTVPWRLRLLHVCDDFRKDKSDECWFPYNVQAYNMRPAFSYSKSEEKLGGAWNEVYLHICKHFRLYHSHIFGDPDYPGNPAVRLSHMVIWTASSPVVLSNQSPITKSLPLQQLNSLQNKLFVLTTVWMVTLIADKLERQSLQEIFCAMEV